MKLEKIFKRTIKQLYCFYNLRYNSEFVFHLIEKKYPNLDFSRSDIYFLYTKYKNDLNFKYL